MALRLAAAEERIELLRDRLARAQRDTRELEGRVKALERQTPQARQLEYEADVAMADAAGYDHHGSRCNCSYCYVPPEEATS
jgi:chromosome segregation ATPase